MLNNNNTNNKAGSGTTNPGGTGAQIMSSASNRNGTIGTAVSSKRSMAVSEVGM